MAKRSAAMLDPDIVRGSAEAASTPLADMPTRTAVGMPPEKEPFDARNNGRAPMRQSILDGALDASE